ncbi:FUSC family protein [Rhodoplanes sp. Z2-YC6860]|uniref:FUSC family protein n=1 Tax=Rhodoplanes sp. Z2-YC6860 TaxID=674703 RepID=UPI0018DCEFC7|nr:FUSC family protein [Rhodoplanes sp. Z2-YC6860]
MNLTTILGNPRLRFCLRVTTSAIVAFTLAQVLSIPLHGLWAVLTAVVVTQMSVGGSLKATTDYIIGTLGGAVYGSAIAVLVPHPDPLAVAGTLALAIVPLAYAAALNPSFRVAPFTAVIVLLISSQLGEAPIESALYRLLEVVIGGAVAVVVSLLVFPARAHALGLDAAGRVLELMANALPRLLAAFTASTDPLENNRIQDEIGQAVSTFQATADEAMRERMVNLIAEPDPGPLARTLLRLRHDLVIIGRAGVAPLPERISGRLPTPLNKLGAAGRDYFLACAAALTSRKSAPPLEPIDAAIAAYASEIAAIRAAGLTQGLPVGDLEHIFGLGFALQQLQHNFADMQRVVQDWARGSTLSGKSVAP